jgi:hypothetical protein
MSQDNPLEYAIHHSPGKEAAQLQRVIGILEANADLGLFYILGDVWCLRQFDSLGIVVSGTKEEIAEKMEVLVRLGKYKPAWWMERDEHD